MPAVTTLSKRWGIVEAKAAAISTLGFADTFPREGAAATVGARAGHVTWSTRRPFVERRRRIFQAKAAAL